MMTVLFHHISKKNTARADVTVRGGFRVAAVLLPFLPLGTSNAGSFHFHTKKLRGGGKDGNVAGNQIADTMQSTGPRLAFQKTSLTLTDDPCPGSASIKVDVKTDDWPQETSWSVVNDCNGDVLESMPSAEIPEYNQTRFLYTKEWCLPETEALWKFTIEDSGHGGDGDGLWSTTDGEGYYNVTVDGKVVGSGDEFGKMANHTFGSGCPPTTSPKPSSQPTESLSPTEDPCPNATAIELTLMTNKYPLHTSWSLIDDCTGANVGTSLSSAYDLKFTLYSRKWCLPMSTWTWTIEDERGNGICCDSGEGYYEIKLDREVVARGGEFEGSESHTFGMGCAPTSSPRPSASPTESLAPTEDPCPGKTAVKVNVKTDYYPEETSWSLIDECTGLLLGSMPRDTEYDKTITEYSDLFCVDDALWTFTIEDEYNDGMCCDDGEGSYSVQMDGQVVASGGEFEGSENHTFGLGCVPSLSPRPSASPTESLAPTEDPCPGKTAVKVNVKTDDYPEETSWSLIDECTGLLLESMPRDTEYVETYTEYSDLFCLDNTLWTFTIEDEDNDGMCCKYGEGSYSVQMDGQVVASGGEFEGSESHTFGIACAPSLSPRPSDPPTKSLAPTEDPCPGKRAVKVNVKTDYYPEETSWSLIDECTGLLLESMPRDTEYDESITEYSDLFCLDDTQWTFTIEDKYNDGICCGYGEGSYSVQMDGQVVTSGGEFEGSESHSFGFACAPSLSPAPTLSVAPSLAPTVFKSSAPTEDLCPGKTTVRVNVNTDDYPGETSWSLIDDCTGLVLESMPSDTEYDEHVTEYRVTFCLDYSQWTFTIEDSGDDGMCCDSGEGSYSVLVNGGEVASGGEFEGSESHTFGACANKSNMKVHAQERITEVAKTLARINR